MKPRPVKSVGVLGAGFMGAGIAAANARSGIRTSMVDVDDARLADGLKRASRRRHEPDQDRPRHSPRHGEHAGSLEHVHIDQDSSPTADVVIEAITENEAVKKDVYKSLAGVIRDDAILASNTSTISITRMAESAPHPERFVGMHFFNPVDRMELVEVIRGEKTSDETVATIVALAKQIRKTPIVVKDCAGFLVNRVLFPYMNESLILLEDGASVEAIDRAATKFGMPMGPLDPDRPGRAGYGRLRRQGGRQGLPGPDRDIADPGRDVEGQPRRQEVADEVLAVREESRSRSRTRPRWRSSPGTGKAMRAIDPEEITDRLFLPMLLEATRVLEEGIVREPGDVDMGLILGIGFPPFRGGILRWCDSLGAGAVVEKLAKYSHLGKRFEPTESLLRLAKTGETFYPRPKLVTG